MLLQGYLQQAVEKNPDKDVLIYGSTRLSYAGLEQAAQALGAWLQSLGLQPGFRVIVLTDDPFEYIASYFGVLIGAGVVVGANTQTSVKALTFTVSDSEASVVLANGKYTRVLRDALPNCKTVVALAVSSLQENTIPTPNIQADLTTILSAQIYADRVFRSPCDLAQIIYTSGTTGKPKGVMLRHANLTANTDSTVQYLSMTEKDRGMAVLPFFYSYGNSVMLTHIAAGGSLVVNQSFMYPNVILQEMLEQQVTGFFGVPSTYAILLHRSSITKFKFPALRYITQAGAAMSPQLVKQLQAVFPGVEIFVMYGQTEAAPRLSYLPSEEVVNRPGSIGKAIPGVNLTLRDIEAREVEQGEIGEIVAQGDNIMAGYWQREKETAEVLRPEGLWTGDLARSDEEGFLYIVSRKSDIIKSGSHRIGPKEIEDTLAEHPAVHEVAVVGIKDEILDERIRACVVLKDGEKTTDREMIKFCRRLLPAFKVPQEVVFYEALPKTETGKIKKTDLRDAEV
jgi:acyl-CoA synthetase (AMP-forming)/AMP-acid ligase II